MAKKKYCRGGKLKKRNLGGDIGGPVAAAGLQTIGVPAPIGAMIGKIGGDFIGKLLGADKKERKIPELSNPAMYSPSPVFMNYSDGGVVPIAGGRAMSVQGPKHGKGGVELPEFGVEVEGGETIDYLQMGKGGKVYISPTDRGKFAASDSTKSKKRMLGTTPEQARNMIAGSMSKNNKKISLAPFRADIAKGKKFLGTTIKEARGMLRKSISKKGSKREYGGELSGRPEGAMPYVFSDRLEIPDVNYGKMAKGGRLTFAKAHKLLLARGAGDEEIESLAHLQEATAGRNSLETTGGFKNLAKREEGGFGFTDALEFVPGIVDLAGAAFAPKPKLARHTPADRSALQAISAIPTKEDITPQLANISASQRAVMAHPSATPAYLQAAHATGTKQASAEMARKANVETEREAGKRQLESRTRLGLSAIDSRNRQQVNLYNTGLINKDIDFRVASVRDAGIDFAEAGQRISARKRQALMDKVAMTTALSNFESDESRQAYLSQYSDRELKAMGFDPARIRAGEAPKGLRAETEAFIGPFSSTKIGKAGLVDSAPKVKRMEVPKAKLTYMGEVEAGPLKVESATFAPVSNLVEELKTTKYPGVKRYTMEKEVREGKSPPPPVEGNLIEALKNTPSPGIKRSEPFKTSLDVNFKAGVSPSTSSGETQRAIGVVGKVFSDTLGVKPTITSTKRSKEENEREGGVDNSRHLTGEAFDISYKGLSRTDRGKLAAAMKSKLGKGWRVVQESNHFHIQYEG